jgi:hypothetical protein
VIKFLIWSNQHGAWWAPGGRGYTLDITVAGRFSKQDATAKVVDAGAYGPHRLDGVPDEVMVLAPEHRWDSGPPESGSLGYLEQHPALKATLRRVLRDVETPRGAVSAFSSAI